MAATWQEVRDYVCSVSDLRSQLGGPWAVRIRLNDVSTFVRHDSTRQRVEYSIL